MIANRRPGGNGCAGVKLALGRVAEFVGADGGLPPDDFAQGYSIDSRTVRAGELFFAVKGERLDGHDYVAQALEKGAIAAVVRKDQRDRYPSNMHACWRWTTR